MIVQHTTDISDLALDRLRSLAAEHDLAPLDFACVFFSESGMRAGAFNPVSPTAHGIFQAIPAVLKGLGFRGTPAEYRAMSCADQMQYASLYYKPHRGLLKSRTHVYLANFLPALIRKADDPQALLSAKGGYMGWVYGSNATFDSNKDGKISVWELDAAIDRACRGPRWQELRNRITEAPILAPTPPQQINSIYDLQVALDFLRFAPGPLDGALGSKTIAALKKYQADRGLVADGIFGPKTKAAIETELRGKYI